MIETKVSSIDRIIHHCEVISIPAGSVPKNIVVQLPGGDGPRVLAWWNGATLAVGSMVKLLKRGLDGTYEIFGLDGGTPTPLNNYTATDDPQPDDDADDGYSAGSIWLNITDHRAWICIISTANAAVWRPFGLGPLATFFLHEEASDIATYQQLLETPAEDAENDDSVSVGSGDGEVLIKAFATDSGGLGLTLLPGGDWEFHIYSYVDNAVGVSQIVVRVYKYEVDTTETELFNVTSQEIDDLSVAEYTVSSVQPDFALVATDRLVVKYFAQTTSVTNRTVHLVYEGMTNYSHIHTPLSSSGGATGGGIWPGPDEIKIASTSYADLATAYSAASAGDVILLGEGNYTLSGLLTVAKNITIAGLSARVTTITYGGANHSVLLTESCRLLNVTIASTSTTSSASALAAAGSGKTFNVDDCIVTKTGTAAEGNGVYFAAGTLNIKNTEITASGATTSVAVRNDTVSGAGTCRLSGCRINGATWDIFCDQTGTTITLEDTVLVNNLISVVSGVLKGSYQAATTGDLYPAGDRAGIWQRKNAWFTPSDDFNAFSGYTWLTGGDYDGAPSGISVTAAPSLLRLVNDNTAEDHFAYQAASGTTFLTARVTCGAFSYIGLRIDNAVYDGTTDDYIMIKLVDSATAGIKRVLVEYTTAGVGGLTAVHFADTIQPGQFVILRIGTDGANVFANIGTNSPATVNVVAAANVISTISRKGIVFGQRTSASNTDLAGYVDWIV